MVIDIHTHTFPEKIAKKALTALQGNCHTALFSDGTERQLLESEKAAGINVAVVQPVATYPEQVVSINNHIIQRFSSDHPEGILSFAAMHPACPAWEEELERICSFGIPGIKIHPPYIQMGIDDPKSVKVLKKCKELGLIVLIHSGWDVGVPNRSDALPYKIRKAMDAVGEVKLIAAHMAGWKCWDQAIELLSDTGIYLDTAFSLGKMVPAPDRHPWQKNDLQLLSESEFCDIVHIFGTDRILFGTDSPWADPLQEVRKIRALPLGKDELNAICGENARRLLKL